MLPSHSSFDSQTLAERRPSAIAGPGVSHDPRAEQGDGQQIPVLGKTLLFRGELSAEEDVILQGRVEGSIRHARNLIIGTDGSVLGDVYASHLTVEGLVEGDLHCSEAVIVKATAQVRGNIFAPRVGIMEGATFNGRVEMDPAAAAKGAGVPSRAPTRQAAAARPPQGGASPSASRPAPTPSAASPPASAAGATLSGAAVEQILGSPGAPKK